MPKSIGGFLKTKVSFKRNIDLLIQCYRVGDCFAPKPMHHFIPNKLWHSPQNLLYALIYTTCYGAKPKSYKYRQKLIMKKIENIVYEEAFLYRNWLHFTFCYPYDVVKAFTPLEVAMRFVLVGGSSLKDGGYPRGIRSKK